MHSAFGMEVYVLAGQSNMAGRGGVQRRDGGKYFEAPEKPPPVHDERIQRFSASGCWEFALEPLHKDIDKKVAGIGPGMFFAKNLIQEQPAVSVGLVPCAIGETSIATWQEGGEHWTNTVNRTRAALAAAPGARLAGLLWYQGESDAVPESVEGFKSASEKVLQSLRAALGAAGLPIVQVAITCCSPKTPNAHDINDLQRQMKLPFLATVDARGLELHADGVHLTVAAQVQLAHNMFNAFKQLTSTTAT